MNLFGAPNGLPSNLAFPWATKAQTSLLESASIADHRKLKYGVRKGRNHWDKLIYRKYTLNIYYSKNE